MSVLKTAQGIEKLQLDNNLNSSLSTSTQNSIDEELANKMKKFNSLDDGSVSPPHGGKKRREEDPSYAPVWQKEEYTDDMVGFHKEIEDFYEYIKPSAEEAEMRKYVVETVREAVLQMWPNIEMHVFGSYRTNLYLPTSDIDIVLLGECSSPTQKLFMLREGLVRKGIAREDSVRVLDRAVVPIIKFTHRTLDIKIDISINQKTGLRCVNYIKDFLKKFPNLPKLIFVIKQFLVARELNEVWHGGLSSYALIAMCISLLQTHLYPAARLGDYNLGVLLQEFFELYGKNFNYDKTCIRIKDGGSYIMKSEFKSAIDTSYSLLTIEDPLTEGNDLGRGSYAMHQVRDAFCATYRRLGHRLNGDRSVCYEGSTLLQIVVEVPDEMKRYRQVCAERWRILKAESRMRLAVTPLMQPSGNYRQQQSQVKAGGDEPNSYASHQACQPMRPPAELYTENALPRGMRHPHQTNNSGGDTFHHPHDTKRHHHAVAPSAFNHHNNHHHHHNNHNSGGRKKSPGMNNHHHHHQQQQTAKNSSPQQHNNADPVAIPNNTHTEANSVAPSAADAAPVVVPEHRRNGTELKKPTEYADLRTYIEESKNKKLRNQSDKVRQNAGSGGKNPRGGAVSRNNSNSSNSRKSKNNSNAANNTTNNAAQQQNAAADRNNSSSSSR